MRYEIRHTTAYEYSEEVTHCYNLGYVLPRETPRQSIIDTKIIVTPRADQAMVRHDYFHNRFYHFSIEEPHDALDVTVHSVLEIADLPSVDIQSGPICSEVFNCLKTMETEETLSAREYVIESPFIKWNDKIRAYAQPSFDPNLSFLSCVMNLTQRIFSDFTYDPGFTNVSTPLAEVLEHKRGVCQDFAHVAIACMRSLGYAARYVSGYLETLPPPGQKKLVGADATHAWFSAFIPTVGWVDFDPTNNAMTGKQHLTTAWGRDYSDVPPLKGILFGGGDTSTLKVEVDVNQVQDDPAP